MKSPSWAEMSSWRFLTPGEAPSGSVEVTLILPSGAEWEALARGALALLLLPENFEQADAADYTPEDAAYEFTQWLLDTFQGWTL
jgi:hypothetical protein